MNPLLFARQLLKSEGASDVYFNNLLNCYDFRTLEHFDAEYTIDVFGGPHQRSLPSQASPVHLDA